MTTTKLAIKNLYKIFGDRPDDALRMLGEGRSKDEILSATGSTVGVQDVNFEIAEGEIFVVMGLSGSGKSTLIRMLNGLIPPTSGEILIDGDDDVANCSDETLRAIRRSKISMVFQHFALFPHRTILENAAYGLKVRGIPVPDRNAKAKKALEQVGLGLYADSYPEQLSGGMQQRVGLARGLAAETEVLLMDEPFGALDPLIRRDMQDELIELQRALNKTIIFITHDLDEALILGDRIAIMKGGRFVQVGTAEEIVANPADDYVAGFTKDIDRSRVFKAGRVARAPDALERAGLTAERALAHMDETGHDALYITESGKPVGVLPYRDAVALARTPGSDIAGKLATNFPRTDPRTLIADLFPLARSGLPIAVIGPSGELTGVVEPATIFAELSAGEQRGESMAAASAPPPFPTMDAA